MPLATPFGVPELTETNLANINLGGGDRVQLKSIWNTSKSEMRNDSL